MSCILEEQQKDAKEDNSNYIDLEKVMGDVFGRLISLGRYIGGLNLTHCCLSFMSMLFGSSSWSRRHLDRTD